jgi:cytochrome c biogenesis protein CcdA
MLRLLGIVISIGMADSINPSTIAPALYLASGPDARKTVSQFTAAVFLVYFLGGALIGLGPGQLILSLVPKPDAATRHVLEVVAGAILIVAGVVLWRYRGRLSRKRLPTVDPEGRASWLLGATITAVELPTAFPYFGAIAAIVGSGENILRQFILLAIFNVCFVLPLLAIVATLWLGGERAQCRLEQARDFLERHWPILLAVVAVVAGGITIALGATGTIRQVKTTLKKTLG